MEKVPELLLLVGVERMVPCGFVDQAAEFCFQPALFCIGETPVINAVGCGITVSDIVHLPPEFKFEVMFPSQIGTLVVFFEAEQ